MGYNPQESLENTTNAMGTLLGVHPIVPVSSFVCDLTQVQKLNEADPHFIRCVKPNPEKVGDLTDLRGLERPEKRAGCLGYMGATPKIVVQVPQNGWFIMEKPIKMDD